MSNRWVSLVAVCAIGVAAALVAPASPAAAATVSGIDVSHHQGAINWSAVAASGQRYAFIKASESTTFVDNRFATNYAGARAAGLLRGAYHFARPDTSSNDAVNEARHFISVAGRFGGPDDLPPVLDLETDGGLGVSALRSWVSAFLHEVETLTGRTPIIYTGPSFWETQLGNTTAFTDYPLWIAHYTTGSPRVPGGWSRYTFWQYTSSGSVSGISGNVDLDRFNGTLTDLQALTPSQPPPPPAGWSNVVRADLDGDGDDELGFYRNVDGRFGWYEMTAAGGLGTHLASYDISDRWEEIVGGDFDGDGDDEVLFYRRDDGRIQTYEMTAAGNLGTGLASYDISPTWTEIVAADLDGDGDDEVLFYRRNDGRVQTYEMTGAGQLGGGALANYEVSATWQEIVDADLDGDGDDEVLFYRRSDGRVQAYEMTGAGQLGGGALSSYDVSTTWTEIVSADLDGNGDDETGFYRRTDGQFNIYPMTATGRLGERLNALDLYP